MPRLFAGAVCLLALCGCDSVPQNPVEAAIVSPATPPSRVAHEGSRIGAVFLPVAPGSATVKGDVLLSVDGTPVNSLADLTAAVNAAAPHHSAEFEMSRDGATRDVTIPL
jgi:S1-C subfamily serine protease